MNKKDGFFVLMWKLFPIYFFFYTLSMKATTYSSYGMYSTVKSASLMYPMLALIVGIIFGIVALVFWLWMLIDLIKRQGLSGGRKVIYFISFILVAILGSSGYYLNNVRKDWDSELKGTKKLFWLTVVLFLVGIIVAPLVALFFVPI